MTARAIASVFRERCIGGSTISCYECGRIHQSTKWRCPCGARLHPVDWDWEFKATPHYRAKAGTRATLTFDLWIHQLNEAYARRDPTETFKRITDETGVLVWRPHYDNGLTADEAILESWNKNDR